MNALRIASVDDPFAPWEVSRAASTLLGRAETMGFLSGLGPISRLDDVLIATILSRLAQSGLAQRAMLQGGAATLPRDPAALAHLLQEVNAALEDSPIPDHEWGQLRSILGDDLLARLCGISQVSLRRYASSARPTPDLVAQRLHILALIVADLRGAYNEFGIRRWFQRPRAQLGGQAPKDFLPSNWSPDGSEATALRDLAAALTGSPAT